MPISRIGKRKMIYGLLIKNFILLSLLVFLSLSLNLFCVHLMFRGGKYNPSEISALNVFTMFWTNHRAYSDHMYYLWHYGYVLLCNILLFPQPKNGIFCKYIFWLIEILKPGSLLRTNSIAFLCKYAIVKLNIYSGKYYVAN